MPDQMKTTEMMLLAAAEENGAHGHEEHEIEAGELAAEYAPGPDGHGAHYGRSISHPPELPHFIQLWFYSEYDELKKEGKNPYGEPSEGDLTIPQILHVGRLEKEVPFVNYAPWENNVFAIIAGILLCALTIWGTKPFRRSKEETVRRPTKAQIAIEGVCRGTLNFCQGVLGDENGRRFYPFLATMFFFILGLNLMGMIPLMRAPSASILITGSLAFTTFLVYFYVGLTKLGPWELFKHLCGSPATTVQWFLAPLMLIIECISFFIAKPVSLALRLFGNILGKDILFGVMLMLGIMAMPTALGDWVGWPFTFPFYFLGLLLSTIQALVFALLSAIYILLCLPHDHDHDHEHAHGEEAAGAH